MDAEINSFKMGYLDNITIHLERNIEKLPILTLKNEKLMNYLL